ncbi:MAG: hypothetical protein U1E58_07060 [Tabrizicola sp.]
MPIFVAQNFRLATGAVLPEIRIAWESWGALNADCSNAILVTHGLTSSHHAADPPTLDSRIGWGHEQIGPGLIYDTDRYFVLSSNVLGSFYGSTCAASMNPATGAAWGESFPTVTMEDVVRAQVDRLRAAGANVTYLEIQSTLGHYATTEEPWKWAATAKAFLDTQR